MSDSDLTYDKAESACIQRCIDLIDAIERKPWVLKELNGKD